MATKYSKEQLKRMACEVIEADNQGDDRAFHLVMQLAMKLGMSADDVSRRIEQLAAA